MASIRPPASAAPDSAFKALRSWIRASAYTGNGIVFAFKPFHTGEGLALRVTQAECCSRLGEAARPAMCESYILCRARGTTSAHQAHKPHYVNFFEALRKSLRAVRNKSQPTPVFLWIFRRDARRSILRRQTITWAARRATAGAPPAKCPCSNTHFVQDACREIFR
jgi:hypothetical protein